MSVKIIVIYRLVLFPFEFDTFLVASLMFVIMAMVLFPLTI